MMVICTLGLQEFRVEGYIFHCNARPFALGTFVPPNAKDTNMLVSFVLGNANFSRHPMQNPNMSQWNIGCVGYQTQISCVGHVHFMFFVLISFAFGTQRKPSFQWNMGFRLCMFCENYSNKHGIYGDFHSQNCRKVRAQSIYLFCVCNNGI